MLKIWYKWKFLIYTIFLCEEMSKKKKISSTKNWNNAWHDLTWIKKYGSLYLYERYFAKKGEMKMLNDEICRLRDKLNDSILKGEDYETILKISVELDELIAKHYVDDKKLKVCSK